ncbi:MAG: metallopeptidase TldD-related protein, partial [Acidimicrobiaceae bacterium]
GCLAMQVQPGNKTQAELISAIDDGVLIQDVSGMHSGVNTISGDFSTGASGIVIKNGTLGAPIREFTIASTLQKMLLYIVDLGNDIDWLPMRAVGLSLVVNDVMMSGS